MVLTATVNVAAEPEALVVQVGTIDRNDDGLTEEQIASVVESSTAVLTCDSDKRLTGQAYTVRMKVDQRGRVSRVTVSTTQRRLRKCLERALRALRFSKHAHPTSAVVHFSVGSAASTARAVALVGDGEGSLGVANGAGVRSPGADLDAQLRAAGGSGASKPVDGSTKSALPMPVGSIREVQPTNAYNDAVRRKVEAAYMAGLRRCYKAALERAPGVARQVELRLQVGTDGRVVAVRVVDPDDDRELESCFEQHAAGWRFKTQAAESAIVIHVDLSPPSP